jgi:hypothetical protein
MMLVKTLEEKEYKWNIPERCFKTSKRKVSKPHERTRELLQELYPTCKICEEVPVRISANKKLYLDFFIPTLMMAVEIHGEQHFSLTSHFHKHLKEFYECRANDIKKAEWCELNNIRLVALYHRDDEEKWKQIIQN